MAMQVLIIYPVDIECSNHAQINITIIFSRVQLLQFILAKFLCVDKIFLLVPYLWLSGGKENKM